MKAPTASQNPVDVGQSFTLTATVTGGSAPISYQWESASGSDISGATSQTYTETPVAAAAGTLYFRANVTDKYSETANSPYITETADSALTASISSSKNPIDYGQSVTFTATASGGSGSQRESYIDINGIIG